jgi:hypothetical protein
VVGGFRPETVETYRRDPGHVLRNLSGAALTFTGLPIGSKGHSRIPDMPPCRAMHIAGYALPVGGLRRTATVRLFGTDSIRK